MKSVRRQPPATPVRSDLTPMIDVTFLILIFFMLTIRFRTLEGTLDSRMPKDVGMAGTAADPIVRARVTIEVLAEGTRLAADDVGAWDGRGPYRFGPDRRLSYSCGPRRSEDFGVVREYLRSLRESDPELQLVVDARSDTIYADAVAVIDMARALGFDAITLAAARP